MTIPTACTILQKSAVTLSLTGCGHLLVYQLGACRQLLLAHDNSDDNFLIRHVVGASGGALVAAIVANKSSISLEDYATAFIQARGRGLELLQQFWSSPNDATTPVSNKGSNNNNNFINLHIATTRCEDGSAHVFSFAASDLMNQPHTSRDQILTCIRASCLIPPTFHPVDVVASSPSPYPNHEGIAIQDAQGNWGYHVDGGIAAPAPVVVPHYDNDADHWKETTTRRIIISPIAGTSARTARISPTTTGRRGWSSSFFVLPQIQVQHDMGIQPSWFNLRALQMASGNVTSTELQSWYDQGQDDAKRFLESILLEEK